jgi:hypothetical protein
LRVWERKMEEDIMHDRDVEPPISATVGDSVFSDCEIEQGASKPDMVSSEVGPPIYPKGSGSGCESAADAAADRSAS